MAACLQRNSRTIAWLYYSSILVSSSQVSRKESYRSSAYSAQFCVPNRNLAEYGLHKLKTGNLRFYFALIVWVASPSCSVCQRFLMEANFSASDLAQVDPKIFDKHLLLSTVHSLNCSCLWIGLSLLRVLAYCRTCENTASGLQTAAHY